MIKYDVLKIMYLFVYGYILDYWITNLSYTYYPVMDYVSVNTIFWKLYIKLSEDVYYIIVRYMLEKHIYMVCMSDVYRLHINFVYRRTTGYVLWQWPMVWNFDAFKKCMGKILGPVTLCWEKID